MYVAAGRFIFEMDVRTSSIKDTIVYLPNSSGFTSLTCDDNSILYFGYINLYSYNIDSKELADYGPISISLGGDLTWSSDKLFGLGYSNQGPRLLEFNTSNLPSILHNYAAGNASAAITTTWKNDCSDKNLLIGDLLNDIEEKPYTNILIEKSIEIENCDTICPFVFPPPEDLAYYYGFASYDNFIEVCELRLDLDYNDSGSRFGPHYYSDPICTRIFPVADRDVWIRSLVGAVDSATVRLRPAGSQVGFDRLHYAEVPGIAVTNLGDTLLTAVVGPGGDEVALREFLSGVTLETTAEVVAPGERIVETYLYAGGIRSDQARSFIQVRPEIGSEAGPDLEVVACDDEEVNLLDALGPGVTPGGTWSPWLIIPNTYRSDIQDPGLYRYVTTLPGCPPDTSYVTVRPPAPAGEYLPLVNTTQPLCLGDTISWRLGLPEIDTVEWFDGYVGLTRELAQPGLYAGFLTDSSGCGQSFFLQLTPSTDSLVRGTTIVGGCRGEELTYENELITTDTSIVHRIARPGACDSLHETRFVFSEPPGRGEVLAFCAGDTLRVADTLIATPGTYRLRLPAATGCDTLLTLFVSQWPVYESTVDTSLRAGDTLRLADTLITTPGEYAVVLSSGSGCDSTVFVSVDLLDTVRDGPTAFAYRAPTLLRNGETIFRLSAGPRAAPLRVARLQIFDVSGRPVRQVVDPAAAYWSPGQAGQPSVPAGIYFYRAAVEQGARRGWVSGKIVVQ